jgi:hypothetical protein
MTLPEATLKTRKGWRHEVPADKYRSNCSGQFLGPAGAEARRAQEGPPSRCQHQGSGIMRRLIWAIMRIETRILFSF